jgi:Divergent polysaccharide deacetylase/Caspase domain
MGEAGLAGSRLLNPGATAAIVLGAHDWTSVGLTRAPSFLRSARRIVAYLYDPSGLAVDPDLVLDLFDDPGSGGDQLTRIRDTLDTRLRERRDAGRLVTDLLVHYVGHGQTDDQGQLSLLVQHSSRGMEAETGIKAPDLARALRIAAPQQRRSIILDCCFSEAVAKSFIGMGGNLDQQVTATAAAGLADDQPARGTLLLCSSPVGRVSMGAPNAEHTLFTGAVLEVLQQGVEGRPSVLSFADLRDAAYERMVVNFGAQAPRPVLHQVNAAHGDLTRAPAFPNRALAPARTEPPLALPPGQHPDRVGFNPTEAAARPNVPSHDHHPHAAQHDDPAPSGEHKVRWFRPRKWIVFGASAAVLIGLALSVTFDGRRVDDRDQNPTSSRNSSQNTSNKLSPDTQSTTLNIPAQNLSPQKEDPAPERFNGRGLLPAPDKELIEPGPNGSLPIIGHDGRQARQAYARPFDPADKRSRIAITISELGPSPTAIDMAINHLPAEVSLAFTPYPSSNLGKWISLARAAGHEVLLNLPMEPADYPINDPGPEALLTALDPPSNLERLNRVMSQATGYVGLTG